MKSSNAIERGKTMAESVIIYGKSGSGKSRSLINFAEDEILLVNTIRKRLPFQKKFKYVLNGSDTNKIKDQLGKMPCKVAVIDDCGYEMITKFMNGHGKGDQFKLYNDIADSIWTLFNYVKYELPDDVIVYFIFHEDSNDMGEVKIRTIGKLLDQKVCLEGLVTVCLRAMKQGTNRYFFRTQSDGYDISKSPEGMFDLEIPNDLKAVDTRIREFYEIGEVND